MKALEYANGVVSGEIVAPKYVILQAKEFVRVAVDEHPKYVISTAKLGTIKALLDILIMPKGLLAGEPMSKALTGYQWFFITAVFCTVYRSDRNKRRPLRDRQALASHSRPHPQKDCRRCCTWY